MKSTRLFLSVILAAVTCSSMAQGIIIYKSNGTTEKLPYVAVDSIVPYAGDKQPEALPDPKYVDLGLPSGTLWADRNVGASAPEATGGYYAWGETEEKTSYSWDSYMCTSRQCGTSSDPIRANYLIRSSYSLWEGSISKSEFDVATKQWGAAWAMPTKEQVQELWNNCTTQSVTINDVPCTEFTGPNGNTIIFSGDAEQGYKNNTSFEKTYSHYWTATIYILDDGRKAYYFTPTMTMAMSDYRNYGMQVRPICVDRNAVDSNEQ